MDYISDGVLREVINDLGYRANRARRARFLIGGTIISLAVLLSAFITYRVTQTNPMSDVKRALISVALNTSLFDDVGIEKLIREESSGVYGIGDNSVEDPRMEGKDSSQDDDKKNHSTDHISKSINKKEALANTKKLIDNYTKIASVNNSRPANYTDNTYSNLISSIALSAGVVGFLLYILQIAVSFIRYYSRLAELYDSQRTALIASDGDIASAKVLMGILTNDHISLGKEPVTLYGKALDVICEVAKSKST